MSSSPGTLEETHEGRASYLTHTCTSEPQIYSVCWREWGREGNTIPHLTHTWLTNLKSKQPATYPHTLHSRWIFLLLQTPFKSSLSSPQLPPHLMDLQPFAVWPPPIWNLLLRSPEAFWSEINRQFSTDSSSHLHWTDSSFLGSPTYFLLSPLIFIVCLLLSPFSLLSLWVSSLLIHSHWAIMSSLQIQLLPAQWRTQRLHAHPRSLPLTPDSYFQWPAGCLHLQLQDNWTTGQSWDWKLVRLEISLFIT